MEDNVMKTLSIGFAFERFAKTKYPVFADYREYDGAHVSTYHSHDFVQIWYCYDNYYFHRIGQTVHRCEKGSVVVVPAGTEHNVWFDEPAKVLNLNVSYDILLKRSPQNYKNAAVQMFLGDFFPEVDPAFTYYRMLSPQSQATVEKVFSWFVLLGYEPHCATNDVRIWENLEEIFSLPEFSLPEHLLEKALHTVQSRVRPIFQILSYLNDHYSEKITDEQLLQVGNISRAVMYRYFKRVTGETYSQYLQKLRVRRAHLYMKNTTYHITQIAQICGFYDVCHMTHAYTKYMGHSPKVQRQILRELYQNMAK